MGAMGTTQHDIFFVPSFFFLTFDPSFYLEKGSVTPFLCRLVDFLSSSLVVSFQQYWYPLKIGLLLSYVCMAVRVVTRMELTTYIISLPAVRYGGTPAIHDTCMRCINSVSGIIL